MNKIKKAGITPAFLVRGKIFKVFFRIDLRFSLCLIFKIKI